jgi:hypothetical protein
MDCLQKWFGNNQAEGTKRPEAVDEQYGSRKASDGIVGTLHNAGTIIAHCWGMRECDFTCYRKTLYLDFGQRRAAEGRKGGALNQAEMHCGTQGKIREETHSRCL